MSLVFVPGFPPANPRLLGRFLSPIADGVAAHYVRLFTRPGDLVLDPFGQSPSVAVETLSLDRRVIVAATNPILRLAISLAVRPPGLAELKAALTLLGDAPVGPGERLESQLKAMYQTTCAECQTPTTADSFEWDAELGEPVEKHYVCLKCGGPRDAATDEADRALAARFARTGPDYHYLLARTIGTTEADRARAEEALSVYPARTLNAIAAVLHKFERLEVDREPQRLLSGLLLAAFDATTGLAQERPKMLTLARRYREMNFWHALETALGLLAGTPVPDCSASLEELLARTDGPAIHVYAGPMRQLASRLPAASSPLLLTAPPRPNPALWSLSAAWGAWLWGHDAVEPFASTLHRRRYDWTWHARALHQTLAAARTTVAPDGRLVGLLAEAEPGFNGGLLAAAAGAGYALAGWALRADTAEAQVEYALAQASGAAASAADRDAQLSAAARDGALVFLRARAEPSRWAGVHFAAWAAAAPQVAWNPDEPLAALSRAVHDATADAHVFERFSEPGADDPASGQWYVAEGAGGSLGRPLADRVEAEVVRRLGAGEPVDEHELLPEVYSAFPGVLTPSRGLLAACLASYATRDEAGQWRLRGEDAPAARAAELQTILAELRALAGRHGFEATVTNPQEWREAEQPVYIFAVLASAAISGYVLEPARQAQRRFLVLPGGRASLVEFKLRSDPRLRLALSRADWTIVKFRQVRQMLADASLTRATLEPALARDPLEALTQLALPERGDA